MCGILGVVARRGERPSAAEPDLVSMRDTMERRGPDGAGLLVRENLALAHRRLAILDTSRAGHQPMSTPDGRYHLVYNGELYNDAELRAELLELGAVPGGFRSRCDTETVLFAFAAWGPESFSRLRGMFALAIYDTWLHELHLARDPLGLKPLYYHLAPGEAGKAPAGELTFASSTAALLRHPGIEARPDLPMASAYLTTLRTVLGHRTLFRGVHALQPGERAVHDAATGTLRIERFARTSEVGAPLDEEEAVELVRASLEDSVSRHLRSDVPLCGLLSGGLDSSILCRIATDQGHRLQTWCSGGPRQAGQESDLEFARQVAGELGTDHHEVVVDRQRFITDWTWMVEQTGTPLSTPNEVAIHAISRGLRDGGQVVALSGEGADELFGGYEAALDAAAWFESRADDPRSGGRFHLEAMAWIAPDQKPQLLSADAWAGAEEDGFLGSHYEESFARARREAGPRAGELDAHLRFQRQENLTNLVQRLDSASMLASVEGRTPFADRVVANLAERLPMEAKYVSPLTAGGGTATATRLRGKRVLRQAWRSRLPRAVVERTKHSFPLPFQDWIEDLGWRLETSPFAKLYFDDEARREVVRDPAANWQRAWPMLNLALWGDRWWGYPPEDQG